MQFSNLKNKKVLVLGLSVTGFAAAKFLCRAGAKCYLSDSNKLADENKDKAKILEEYGVQLEFDGHTEEFIKESDFCILSPSIPPNSDILKELDRLKIPYFSDIELAYKIKPERTKIIAITGTNGKTTTTMLITHILNRKFNACQAGNVGVSPLDYLFPLTDSSLEADSKSKINALHTKEPDFLVIEASSYQLHYTKDFAPDMAVFCNLTPDHINWHGNIENYFYDKAKMFKNMGENTHAILNFDDEHTRGLSSKAKKHFFRLDSLGNKLDAYIKNGKIYYGDEFIINIDDVPIVGVHNLQNVMCGAIVGSIAGLPNDEIKSGIVSFKAPKHRCEFVIKKDGISYYNDSKATNPEASNVAITAFDGKNVVLIAGGRDKNTSLDEFCRLVKERINKVVLIGEAAERFSKALNNVNYKNIEFADSLEDAILKAESSVSGKKPEVVLFSPACASFDMFKNYEARGDAFIDYVSRA